MAAPEKIPSWISVSEKGVLVRLYIQPGASRTGIIGEFGADAAIRLKIRIAAPPVDSAANDELLLFLKKTLGIPASKIFLVRGTSSRTKDVLLQAVTPEFVAGKLVACEQKS